MSGFEIGVGPALTGLTLYERTDDTLRGKVLVLPGLGLIVGSRPRTPTPLMDEAAALLGVPPMRSYDNVSLLDDLLAYLAEHPEDRSTT